MTCGLNKAFAASVSLLEFRVKVLFKAVLIQTLRLVSVSRADCVELVPLHDNNTALCLEKYSWQEENKYRDE